MRKRTVSLVLNCLESVYFALALVFPVNEAKCEFKELIEKPEFELTPTGFDAVVASFAGDFLIATLIFFVYFLVQRRWIELLSPTLYIVGIIATLVAQSTHPSPDTIPLLRVITAGPLILLNLVLLYRTALRFRTSGESNPDDLSERD